MTPFATWQLPFSVCLHFVLSRVCRNSYVQCRVSLWQSVTRQVQPTSRDVFVVYTVEQGAEPWKNQPFGKLVDVVLDSLTRLPSFLHLGNRLVAGSSRKTPLSQFFLLRACTGSNAACDAEAVSRTYVVSRAAALSLPSLHAPARRSVLRSGSAPPA